MERDLPNANRSIRGFMIFGDFIGLDRLLEGIEIRNHQWAFDWRYKF